MKLISAVGARGRSRGERVRRVGLVRVEVGGAVKAGRPVGRWSYHGEDVAPVGYEEELRLGLRVGRT